MIEKKTTTTRERVTPAPTTPEAKQPAAQTQAAPEAVEASEADTSTSTCSTPAQQRNDLPLDRYLSGGYYKGEGKGRYTDPALIDQAEEIGKALAAGKVPPTAFNRLIRTLKDAEKLSFPAQQGALKKLLPQVTDLENHKKAPPLLREVVERNQAAVQTEADFAACLDHFKDIAVYLVAQAASAGT